MKDLGSLSYFLVIHVHRDKHDMQLNQAKYILDLLDQVIGKKDKFYPCLHSTHFSFFQ